MDARSKLLLSGLVAIGLAVSIAVTLAILYWPFQAPVQIVAPFLIVGVLLAIGLAILVTAHFLPVAMFEAPLTGAPRWADWLSLVAVGIAAIGLVVALALPGPLNPAAANPAFVSGYGVITGCTTSPPSTAFEIHYVNSGGAVATGVTAAYRLYALNATTQTYDATVSIGSVPPHTSGSVAVTAPLSCARFGSSVAVTFTWS